MLQALAAHARGAVTLAEGDARAALGPLRRAFEVWRHVEAPYEAARARVLIGLACRSLVDDEAGELELGAARAVFERLGAAPELARLDSLGKRATPAPRHGLTSRELQVLRLVGSLNLTDDETDVVKQALETMVRRRAGGGGAAKLTNPINVGIGTK